jgi:threonine/homoserine/homoserine lactone efflux protein
MNTDVVAWLLSIVAFAVAMCATPGPNNAMVASSGATFGFKATLPHMLGIAIGFPAMMVAVALGAGDLFRTYPAIHDILRWVGAIYLLWLAFKIGTAAPSRGSGKSAIREDRNAGKPLTFFRAALFQWVNPKAWIAALSAIATYTTAADIYVQAFVLAAIFLLVTFPSIAFWTMTGVGAARLLKSDRSLRAFNIGMAALLVASLAPLLWAE